MDRYGEDNRRIFATLLRERLKMHPTDLNISVTARTPSSRVGIRTPHGCLSPRFVLTFQWSESSFTTCFNKDLEIL